MNTTVQSLLDIVGKKQMTLPHTNFKRKHLDEHQKRKRKWDYII